MRSLMFGENEVRFEHGAHLVGDRFERVAQHFERDRIDHRRGRIAKGNVVHLGAAILSLLPGGPSAPVKRGHGDRERDRAHGKDAVRSLRYFGGPAIAVPPQDFRKHSL